MASRIPEPVIGIDLGTSYSCVAVYYNGTLEVIPNDYGSRLTPSYVNFTENGRLFVDNALNQISRTPSNRLFDIKRLVGQRYDSFRVQYLDSLLPFHLCNLNNRVAVEVLYDEKKERFTTEEILAMELLYLKDQAEKFLKMSVSKAVIGVPCSFNALQRESIRDAAKIAGLSVLRLHSDPGLAICDFVTKNPTADSKVILIDVGGGHCNVGVSSVDRQAVHMEAVSGKSNLGGQDFTNRLLEHVIKDIEKKRKTNLSKEPRALCRLLVACEKAKKELSSTQKTVIQVDALPGDFDYQYILTRDVFEKLNDDLFDQIVHTIDFVLVESDIRKEVLEHVILCGGSTRIPALRHKIQQLFDGRPLNQQINADEAVAEGAALLGSCLARDSMGPLSLLDVCPFSLGIETVGNSMSTLLFKNKPFPSSSINDFKPAVNGQGGYFIQLYEGESSTACENRKLAQLLLLNQSTAVVDVSKCQLIQYDDRKQDKLQVTVSVDEDLTIKLQALDLINNRSGSTVVTGFTSEEIAHMVQRAENLRNDESINQLMSQQKNQLENTAIKMQSQSELLSKAANQILGWLEANQKCEMKEMTVKQKEMSDICNVSASFLRSLVQTSPEKDVPKSSTSSPPPSYTSSLYPAQSYEYTTYPKH